MPIHDGACFLLQRVADLFRVYNLHIIGRNHSNAFFIDYPAEDKNLFNDTHREAGVSLNSVQEWLVGCF